MEVVEGMQFDRGYISPYFVTNSEKMECEMDSPYILLYDKKISNLKDLLPVLESVAQSGRPLLIIAEDVDNEAPLPFTITVLSLLTVTFSAVPRSATEACASCMPFTSLITVPPVRMAISSTFPPDCRERRRGRRCDPPESEGWKRRLRLQRAHWRV